MNIRKRKGKIKLSRDLVLSMDQGALSTLFGNFFPLHTETNPIFDSPLITYYGVSKHFKEIEEGEELPLYEPHIEFHEQNDLHTIDFVEIT